MPCILKGVLTPPPVLHYSSHNIVDWHSVVQEYTGHNFRNSEKDFIFKLIMSSCHVIFLCLMILILMGLSHGTQSAGPSSEFLQIYDENYQNESITITKNPYSSHRKLLSHGSCSNRDISISQSQDYTSGIPQYIVQIVNTCVSGCAPSNIHLHCGWFASARMVNPRTFKRLSYDDCLVNGGKPLKTSRIIRFTYSNSFMYALVFKSAKFC